MKIIQDILLSDHFKNKPPVLIDIGASGEINAKWTTIARYSSCIAFDADDRDFRIDEEINKGYKKLVTINRIVTARPVKDQAFYLTASPYCSSLLEPDLDKLSPWIFKDLFRVEKITTLPAITIEDALRQTGIAYIDWFKSDTQGTDLRLFANLPVELLNGILAAEFEPGIIDAYKGEDKLHMVMQQMDQERILAIWHAGKRYAKAKRRVLREKQFDVRQAGDQEISLLGRSNLSSPAIYRCQGKTPSFIIYFRLFRKTIWICPGSYGICYGKI